MMSTNLAPVADTRQISEFHRVREPSGQFYPAVENFFKQTIAPIYGDQSPALEKIQTDLRRRCEVLVVDHQPVGVIVYKKDLQDEFSALGLTKSLEVKTLALIEHKRTSGKGYGSILIERIETLARKRLAESIHLTVSGKADGALPFFRKKGFEIVKKLGVLASSDQQEYLLSKKLVSKVIPISTAPSHPKTSVKKRREIPSDQSSTRDATSKAQDSSAPKNPLKRRKITKKTKPTAEEGPQPEVAAIRESSTASYLKDRRDSQRPQHLSERSGVRPYGDPQRQNFRSLRQGSSHHHTGASGTPRHHEITLRKMYIHQIRRGDKTVEGRINSGMCLRFREGDRIRFFYKACPDDDVYCTIRKIEKFRSFEDMLKHVGYQKCLAEVRSLEDAIDLYQKIPGYPSRASKFGVLGIHVQVIAPGR